MRAVTHNIVHTLNKANTSEAVRRALVTHPQIVSLQEFDPNDDLVLRRVGEFVGRDLSLPKNKKEYYICRGKARGLPVLLRRPYVDAIHSMRSVTVAKRRSGVRPTPGTEVIFTNRHGVRIAVLNTHPTAHHEKPAYRAAFVDAKVFVEAWALRMKRIGLYPIVMMDGNGLVFIPGMTSCWEGNQSLPTGPGGRTIDVIFTLQHALNVDTFGTPSDHDGVVAQYSRF